MEELRIVVVGKAGNEKTALINTILGKESTGGYFGSECKVIKGVFEKEPVAFIDTPGLLRIDLTDEKLEEELRKCILYAAPGPHVFLYVKEKEPFTTEEVRAVKILEGIFKNSRAFFLGVIMSDEVISEKDWTIIQRSFMGKFSGCIVFNTEEPNVSELMKKIKEMAEKRGHYTNELSNKAKKINKNQGKTAKTIGQKIQRSLVEFYHSLKMFLNREAQ